MIALSDIAMFGCENDQRSSFMLIASAFGFLVELSLCTFSP